MDRLRDESHIQRKISFLSGLPWEQVKIEIDAVAYRLWEEAGRPEGKDFDFWVLAEHEYLNQLLKYDCM